MTLCLRPLAAIALLASSGRAQDIVLTTESSVADFARAIDQSTFVFTARVEQVAATTTASVPARSNTTVVRVLPDPRAVLVMPSGFRTLRNRTVTVVTTEAGTMAVGAVFLYFAYLVASDTGTALHIVARAASGPVQAGTLAQRVDDGRVMLRESAVAATVQRSALVVLGIVETTSAVALSPALARRAHQEHAPHWVRASMRVERPFKPGGLVTGRIVTVLFSGNRELAYRSAPRLRPGQRGIVLARPVSSLPPGDRIGIPPAGLYYIIEPLDVLSPADTIVVKYTVP